MTHKAGPIKLVDVAIGIVVDKVSPSEIRILITQRTADQVLGGLWELPGGKVEPDESAAAAAVRELHEEVGIEVQTIHTLTPVDHRYDHAHVNLIPFICKHVAGKPQPLQVDQVRWVRPDELADYAFPDASLPILDELRRWLDREID